MPLSPAPLFTDVCPGPEGGQAYWVDTPDGKRIRLATWVPEGAKATVLLFPGRTEYIEKYGHAAGELAARGFATISIDWRGQGLADRLLDNPAIGHVDHFTDYQKDVAALMRAVRELSLPRPLFLLAHSMGGCIGLRAVMEGMPVQAAAFSGPMWGIYIAPMMRAPAFLLSQVMNRFNQGNKIAAGTVPEPYVLAEPFEDNMLTKDPEMYKMMQDQLHAHPELSLGGPSYHWFHEAMAETKHLASRAAPNLPAITFVGTDERIVDVPRITARMESWKGSTLRVLDRAEHEVLMEVPETRKSVFDEIAKHFWDTTTA